MTATEVLRRMLDERGVEWRYKDERTTYWYGTLDGEEWGEWTATEMGGHLHLTFSANGDVVTPKQAIAAALGPATRHPKPHEKWTTVLLPEIAWSWDDSWPDYLSVAHDTHGEWRTYVPEATLGTGTCHPVISDNLTESEGTGDAWADCSECGHLLFVLTDPNSQVPNFCPNCGRRVEQ